MSDISPDDLQRLADLADRLALVRRGLRQTARRPPAKVPGLLAQNIADLADYVTTTAALRAELAHRTGPSAANAGGDWGSQFAATRASSVLYRLTELMNDACALENQVRPRSTIRSHLYVPGLEQRVSEQFTRADNMLSHTITTIRQFRTGLGRARKRDLDREQQAAADPDGPAARILAAPAQYRREELIVVPSGFEREAAATAAAAARRGRRARIVPPTPAAEATRAAPAPAPAGASRRP
ncbi:hypothetical protein ACFC26_14890 [Kitasatospora purpeofusca]|uniref:hypothetical protein n=1 Tax=Kitasatospora purpeofusca TaxID=67352 RepID=UPI0035D87BBE